MELAELAVRGGMSALDAESGALAWLILVAAGGSIPTCVPCVAGLAEAALPFLLGAGFSVLAGTPALRGVILHLVLGRDGYRVRPSCLQKMVDRRTSAIGSSKSEGDFLSDLPGP